jgi:hypothetical protein
MAKLALASLQGGPITIEDKKGKINVIDQKNLDRKNVLIKVLTISKT